LAKFQSTVAPNDSSRAVIRTIRLEDHLTTISNESLCRDRPRHHSGRSGIGCSRARRPASFCPVPSPRIDSTAGIFRDRGHDPSRPKAGADRVDQMPIGRSCIRVDPDNGYFAPKRRRAAVQNRTDRAPVGMNISTGFVRTDPAEQFSLTTPRRPRDQRPARQSPV